MKLLLHTIALEPARWTPAKVFRPLVELLPAIATAGFGPLEVFEPHLALAPDENALVERLREHDLTPVVLSSYLDLTPSTQTDETFLAAADVLRERVDRFGFQKVRLFPGHSPAPEKDAETISTVAVRLRHLAEQRPGVEFLVETHDGSLADDPECPVRLIQTCGCKNVGLLWQPTRFQPEQAEAQFRLQKPFIKHFHLQNRDPNGKFAPLGTGIIPWAGLMGALNFETDATLEFVPRGICAPEQFDLAATLLEAVSETRWVESQAAR